MHRGSPLGARKTVRLMVALTILAWATQTLFHQWGFGAEPAGEKFVAPALSFGCTLELRHEARVNGDEIKFKHLFRWSSGDGAVFGPLSDLTLGRFDKQPFTKLSLDSIRQTLAGAGVNLAMIRFAGAMDCQLFRSDAAFDERIALNQWVQSSQITGQNEKPLIQPTPSPSAAAAAASDSTAVESGDSMSLRQRLVADLAQRLNLSADALEMTFDARDERLLGLRGPMVRFHLMPTRARDLGQVAYDVTASTDSGSQKVKIFAEARAWQVQHVASRAIAYKQILREEDLIERRVLVGHISEDPVLSREQIVGQQAARDIKPGMILTGRMIDSVPLVKSGQLVTVQLSQGTIQLTSVARAMEHGAFGQTIKVRNETSKDIFDVVVTGAQAARVSGSVDLASATGNA